MWPKPWRLQAARQTKATTSSLPAVSRPASRDGRICCIRCILIKPVNFPEFWPFWRCGQNRGACKRRGKQRRPHHHYRRFPARRQGTDEYAAYGVYWLSRILFCKGGESIFAFPFVFFLLVLFFFVFSFSLFCVFFCFLFFFFCRSSYLFLPFCFSSFFHSPYFVFSFVFALLFFYAFFFLLSFPFSFSHFSLSFYSPCFFFLFILYLFSAFFTSSFGVARPFRRFSPIVSAVLFCNEVFASVDRFDFYFSAIKLRQTAVCAADFHVVTHHKSRFWLSPFSIAENGRCGKPADWCWFLFLRHKKKHLPRKVLSGNLIVSKTIQQLWQPF